MITAGHEPEAVIPLYLSVLDYCVMVDITTSLTAAGVKRLARVVHAFRPRRMIRNARKAECLVTNILYDDAFVLADTEFEDLHRMRQKVDVARIRATHSGWKVNGFQHISITYQYYTSARRLLRLAERYTEPARRRNGPEGQRIAAMNAGNLAMRGSTEGCTVPIPARVTTYTIKNLRLNPGNNIISIPCPSNLAQNATIRVKLEPAGIAGPGPSHNTTVEHASECSPDDTASISISFSASDGSASTDDNASTYGDGDGDDSYSEDITFSVWTDKGKGRDLEPSGASVTFSDDITLNVWRDSGKGRDPKPSGSHECHDLLSDFHATIEIDLADCFFDSLSDST
ncbi:hypothetical protein PYCCODRAFT_1431190 [Trametes coccinea BRFM310]|uniref:Uncharacterized protein n=1 Tax=Trametes coccinea (strain BRFM310) TaxID=1353009 RepID=A0A1Y2J0U1_TRAC3|nr:hypothetical protein PYCCODRAFT_1431190 [Trametes coccinea BRFM310]